MALALKRLLALCFALAFAIGATAQPPPAGSALADGVAQCDMAMGSGDPNAPYPQRKPTCIEQVGCLTVPAIATWPAASPRHFRWTSVVFEAGAPLLHGVSVKPELSPPILAA